MGPASLWSLQELRALHGRYRCFTRRDIPMSHRRSRCRKTARDTHKSTGTAERDCIGWPKIKRQGNTLRYFGPLSKSCGCSPPHPPRIGASSNAVFHTQTTEKTWKALLEGLFRCPTQSAGFQPRYGWRGCDCPGTHDTPTFLPSRFRMDRSLQAQRRELTGHFLRDTRTVCKPVALFHVTPSRRKMASWVLRLRLLQHLCSRH